MEDNILIVDDHPVVLSGLQFALENAFAIQNTYTALNAADAIAIVRNNRDIDWIFLDVRLPDTSGLEVLKLLEDLKFTGYIVMLSSESSPSVIDIALKRQACGFISKSFKESDLKACIKTIQDGGVYLSTEDKINLQNYRASALKEKDHIRKNLSKRQNQTLQLMANGYSNKEIAASLNISESTVKSHVHALMSLFSADNRTHCVAEARRLHLFE